MFVYDLHEPLCYKVYEGSHDDEDHKENVPLEHADNIHLYFSLLYPVQLSASPKS